MNIALLFPNVVQYRATVSLLEEETIDFVEHTNIPAVNSGYSFDNEYIVIMSTTNYNRLLNLTGQEYSIQHHTVYSNSKSSKSNWVSILLICYAICITIVATKYYYIDSKNKVDKNYIAEWNVGNTILTLHEKKGGSVYLRYYDENYDYNYEAVEVYRGDKIAHISFDEDENGKVEKTIYYNELGQIVSTYKDLNLDGSFDYGETILECGDTVIIIDRDFDGQYERARE